MSATGKQLDIAFYNRFLVSAEIIETLRSAGHNVLLFSNQEELAGLIKKGNNIDFVLDINFHEFIWPLCVENNIKYVVWSFDSNVRGAITGTVGFHRLRGNRDYLFLFNKDDYEKSRLLHGNSYYLSFSASDSFIREPLDGGFKHQVLCVMNTYRGTEVSASGKFRDAIAKSSESAAKRLELAKGVMEFAVEKHLDIYDRFAMAEFVNEIVEKCGINPFNEKTLENFLVNYTQILSSRQRIDCVRRLCQSGIKTDVYGDAVWNEILPRFADSGCRYLRGAQYHQLPDLYNSARINLNLTQIQNLRSIPQRIYHVLAAGGFVITNYSNEIVSFFEPGRHLETFRTVPELIDKIKYYLQNRDARMSVALEGHKEFIRKHRMSGRLCRICSIVQNS